MEPGLILLDEPASGLSHEETTSTRFWIDDIRIGHRRLLFRR